MLTLTSRLHLFELVKSEGVTRPPYVIRHERAQNARINRSDMCEIRVQIHTRSDTHSAQCNRCFHMYMCSHTRTPTHLHMETSLAPKLEYSLDDHCRHLTFNYCTWRHSKASQNQNKPKRHTHTHAQTGIEIQSSIARAHTHVYRHPQAVDTPSNTQCFDATVPRRNKSQSVFFLVFSLEKTVYYVFILCLGIFVLHVLLKCLVM